MGRAVLVLVMAMGSANAFGEPVAGVRDEEARLRAQRQEKLQQVLSDKAGFAAAIVGRWESSARVTGRWDENYSADLRQSLTELDPENLLAAGEASSYPAMLKVVATGQAEPAIDGPVPHSLGQNFQDLVFNPVQQCRIVDTRLAVGGAVAAGSVRAFDVDGSDLSVQGGSAAGCGIPLGVAQAVEVTIIAVQPAGPGFLSAWGLREQPRTSVLNYSANDVIANTATVQVVPGGGPDFALFSLATTNVVVEVLGYFAASGATRLDCMTVASDVVAVPLNEVSAVDALCPAGRAATGGGHDVAEATIAFPGLFTSSTPLANGWRTVVENHTSAPRNIITFARCCRIPGR
jgi:hypothetical protein